jgi:hypothetical protein
MQVTVSLSGYTLGKTVNGGFTVEYNFSFLANATISPGGTYTLCSNRIDMVNQAQCNNLTSFISHNGDDTYMLIRNSDDMIVDTFGMLGADPGRAFTVCNDTSATQDNTLIRKPSVYRGNPNWMAQAGANASDCEWVIRPLNDFTNGGVHASVRPLGTVSATLAPTAPTAPPTMAPTFAPTLFTLSPSPFSTPDAATATLFISEIMVRSLPLKRHLSLVAIACPWPSAY